MNPPDRMFSADPQLKLSQSMRKLSHKAYTLMESKSRTEHLSDATKTQTSPPLQQGWPKYKITRGLVTTNAKFGRQEYRGES